MPNKEDHYKLLMDLVDFEKKRKLEENKIPNNNEPKPDSIDTKNINDEKLKEFKLQVEKEMTKFRHQLDKELKETKEYIDNHSQLTSFFIAVIISVPSFFFLLFSCF